MSRVSVPKYRRQRQKGKSGDRAFVELQGRRFYLGPYGSEESHRRYRRFLAELAASGGQLPVEGDDLTVEEIAARFLEWVTRDMPGSVEPAIYRTALRRTLELYGDLEGNDFGPRCLKVVRDSFVRDGLARVTCNAHAGRVRRMFKWACEEELVRGDIFHALASVAPLRRGRSEAKESIKIGPANLDHVEATLPFLSTPASAVVRLLILTGARSGEILCMRPCDVDRSGDLWVHKPARHKTARFGGERMILLGPEAQRILEPFLRGRAPGKHCFSPQEAVEELHTERNRNRVTPLGYGNSPGTNRKADPQRKPRESWTSGTFARTIARACKRAGVPKWHAHQLRHLYATRMRKLYDVEAARILLGHSTLAVTEIYAEKDVQKATEIVKELG